MLFWLQVNLNNFFYIKNVFVIQTLVWSREYALTIQNVKAQIRIKQFSMQDPVKKDILVNNVWETPVKTMIVSISTNVKDRMGFYASKVKLKSHRSSLTFVPRKAGRSEKLLAFARSRFVVTRVTSVSRAPLRKILSAFLGPN